MPREHLKENKMNEADNGFEYEGCSTALARTENPQTSKDAAEKMVRSGALNRQEKRVYDAITKYSMCHSAKEFTTKDVAIWMLPMPYYKAYDICRKRFSGLHLKRKIALVFEGLDIKRRDGCRVWRLK